MSDGLRLYDYFASVAAQKVRLTLSEKRLSWEEVTIDLRAGDMLDTEYLKLNPNGVVPTLIHDGRVLVESTVIAEYLDEVFPDPPLSPSAAFDRARMRVWMKRVDEDVHRATGIVSMAIYIRHHHLRKTPQEREAYFARMPDPDRVSRQRDAIDRGTAAPAFATAMQVFTRWIDDIDDALGDSPWLLGNQYTLADIVCVPYMTRLEMLAMDKLWSHAKRPRLARWWQGLKARESYQREIEAKFPPAVREYMLEQGQTCWAQVATTLGQERS